MVPSVILAAGVGSRLGKLTLNCPKTALQVNGKSFFERLLMSLKKAGVTEVYYVSGHAPEILRKQAQPFESALKVKEIRNERFREYNNIYSLWIMRDVIAGKPFILLNSDIIFEQSILETVCQLNEGNWLVVDIESPLNEEAMKVLVENGRLKAIGKHLDPFVATGEYIGIARFDAVGSDLLFREIGEVIASGGTHHWYEYAIGRTLERTVFRIAPIRGGTWIEVDDQADLLLAEELARRLDASNAL